MFGIGLIAVGRSRTGEMEDVGERCGLDGVRQLVDYIVLDELGQPAIEERRNIVDTTCLQIVEDDEARAFVGQPVAQVRADKTGTARDEYASGP